VKTRAARGFTLIEVLVALVIVAVGMAAVMSALSSAANTVSFLRDETFANYVALNKIATLRLAGQIPQTGNSDGDVDYANRSWHWRQEVASTQIPGVVRIDVKVRPKEVKAGDDEAWTTTVSGIAGNSVGRADGYSPNWGAQAPRYANQRNGSTNNGNNGLGVTGNGVGSGGANMQVSPSSGDSGLSSLDSDSGFNSQGGLSSPGGLNSSGSGLGSSPNSGLGSGSPPTDTLQQPQQPQP
jgi:general secretion pathway protein I